MKTKSITTRFLSLLLTAVMLLSSTAVTLTSAALDTSAVSSKTEQQPETIPADDKMINDLFGSEEEDILLDLSTVPDAVGTEKASAAGHVKRLYKAEKSLNTIVFANADGTKTAYYYNYPVKYIDDNGEVKDISLNIVQDTKATGSFRSESAKAATVFPEKITDGILLNDGDVSLRLVPVFDDTKAEITPIPPEVSVMRASSGNTEIALRPTAPTAELADDKTVVYQYDSKTSYEYSLTYSGFKEDIVVSEYTGQTEYSFTLYTNGLTLSADSFGDYYLYDDEGNVKASVGDIVIFTADERNNTFGSLTSKPVIDNEEYILTIHIDADYLADEKTKYPIRIDPTLEICYDNNGAGAIHDVTVNTVDAVSGTSGSISAGKYGDDQSISRILMKFPNLDLSSMTSIESATVYIRDLMCQHEYLTLDCYMFNGNSWTESATVTWNSVGADNLGAYLDTNEIAYEAGLEMDVWHYYDYDITDAVQAWKNDSTGIAKGIIFKAAQDHEDDTTHNYKTFASYNRASNKPSLVIVYDGDNGNNNNDDTNAPIQSGVYNIRNVANSLYLDTRNGGVTSGTVIQQYSQALEAYYRNQLFKVTYLGKYDGLHYYTIRPMTNSGLGLYSDYSGDNAPTSMRSMSTIENWYYITYEQSWAIADEGNGYSIKNGHYDDQSYLTASTSNSIGIQLSTTSTLSNDSKWTFDLYDGEEINGVKIQIPVSSTQVGNVINNCYAYMYSSAIETNGPVIINILDTDLTSTDRAKYNESTSSVSVLKGSAEGERFLFAATYNGAPRIWYNTIDIEPYYGCKEYYEIADIDKSMNCQGYAFWTHDKPSNWMTMYQWSYLKQNASNSNEVLYGIDDVDGIKEALENNWLDEIFSGKWEEVESNSGGQDIELAQDQWLVAFRVGISYTEMDYHFWYRTDTGEWSNKHGDYESQPLDDDLPTDNDSEGWRLYGSSFYNSDIIYYILTE